MRSFHVGAPVRGPTRSSRRSGTPHSISMRPSEIRSAEIEPMAFDAGEGGAVRPRVILIQGASAGLGRGRARGVVRQNQAGALVLTARRIDRLLELASELRERRPELPILTLAADLADPAAPGRLVEE